MNTLVLLAGIVPDPASLIRKGGFWLLIAIVFAESGLLIGFFLPGDSLLFAAGMVGAGSFSEAFGGGKVEFAYPFWVVLVAIFLAAFLGDQVGYHIGKKAGPALFRREDSRLFKQAYVTKTQEFFDRHGPRAIILARFVPIVRTFCPVVAGVGRMDYRRFVLFDFIGAVLWGIGVTLLGYFLGRIPVVQQHIEIALLLLVAVSVSPLIVEFVRHRMKKSDDGAPQDPAAAA